MADSMIARAKTAALVALAQHGSTTDIQEVLVAGNPLRGIPPAALDKMVRAAIVAMREPTEAMIDAYEAVCIYPSEEARMDGREALRDAWITMAIEAGRACDSGSDPQGEDRNGLSGEAIAERPNEDSASPE